MTSSRRSWPLHTRILAGLLLGALAGGLAQAILGQSHPGLQWTVKQVAQPVGQVFLRMIFMIVVPLVFSALAMGVAEIGEAHRIGRVGRAGRDGVAISLVEPRERRLLAAIEKLLRGRIPTAPMPTAADVRSMRLQRTREAVEDLLADDESRERLEAYREAVESLLEEFDLLDVSLAAFALGHEATQGTADASDDVDFAPPAEQRSRADRKGRASDQAAAFDKAGKGKKKNRLDVPSERLFVSVGRSKGITPADLVGALTGETDLKGRDIGAITVHETYSLVEVPEKLARKAVKSLNRCSIKGHRVKVRLDRGR